MNYQKITQFDTANGKGIRTVLWVSGCEHHCPECHNPQTWDKASGIPYTEETTQEILKSLEPSYINGLTLSGGDPLAPYNREQVTDLVKRVKTEYSNKTIWCYTGYRYEELLDLEILKYIDVLVDGEFHIDERNITLPYYGSENQRAIDLIKTTKENRIVEL